MRNYHNTHASVAVKLSCFLCHVNLHTAAAEPTGPYACSVILPPITDPAVLAQASWHEEASPAVGIVATAGSLPQPPADVLARDAPRRVPLTRWEVDALGSQHLNEARFGSFVEHADSFDAEVFGISRYSWTKGSGVQTWS